MTSSANSTDDLTLPLPLPLPLPVREAPREPVASRFGILGHPIQPYLLFPVVAVVILILIWGATFQLIKATINNARSDALASAQELLGTYEAQVVRALREIDQTLKFVLYAADSKGDKLALAELQDRGLLPPNLLFAVSLIDRHGSVVASTEAAHPGSLATQGYFVVLRDAPAADQKLSVDVPHRDPDTGEWRLRFSRRLNAPDGSFGGIVTVAVDAAYFTSGYEPTKLGNHGVLGILGTDGIFRVRRTGDAVTAGDAVNYRSVVRPSGGNDDATVSLSVNPWDRVSRYTSTRELSEFPLAVVIGLSEKERLADAYEERGVYLMRAGVGSALLILLTGALGRMNWQLLQSQGRESAAKIAYAERVEYLAYHDGLTGLPNRSLFSRLLVGSIKMAERNQRRLAVLFLDLDRFKQINDTLGHEAGDELLKEAARRLQSCLRDSDTVARLGGDEFVILLPELDSAEHAAIVAQKILTVLAAPFMLMEQEFRVTASVGICTFPEDGQDEQTLTKHADIAMYQAKQEGKNTFQFYSENLNALSLERLTLESSLRHALERQEFRLFYQAKREIVSGRITGVEALLRWQHPDLGIIAPMQFIPIAEETGLIVPIGKWVLKTACRQSVAWREQGLAALSMAVNLTPRQFSDENLLQDVAGILHETGMPPSLLELEITESLLIRDVEKTLRIMRGVKGMGVKIAVDDFGTCYSSLTTLRQFPLDSIKIDRSFIRDVTADMTGTLHAGPTLPEAIIALGHSLSMTVVAQGVETKDQVDYLRVHACNEVQGFYFNKPLPTGEITQLLENQTGVATGHFLATPDAA